VADNLIRRGLNAIAHAATSAVSRFYRDIDEGLKGVARRTEEADAEAAGSLSRSGHVPRFEEPPGVGRSERPLGPHEASREAGVPGGRTGLEDPAGVVDSSEYRMGRRERDFAGVSESDILNMKSRVAPLGWPPRQWRQAEQELRGALKKDGLHDADVRIQGSSTTFASKNPDKFFPQSEEDLVQRLSAKGATPDEIQRATAAYRAGGFADGTRVPKDMFWDAGHRVGVGERSDYDVQVSSDRLDQRMTAYQADHPGTSMQASHGGHWKDRFVRAQFPALRDWARNWERELGREVNLAGFGSRGPEGPAAFSNNDFVVVSPGA
jgi:hypothetical protein